MTKRHQDSVFRKKLTDAAIRRYVPGATRREIWDANGNGLVLVVQPTGRKTFAMRFRRPDGRGAKLTLGPYDASGREMQGDPVIGQPLTLAAARQLASSLLRRRKMGEDVVAAHKAERQRARALAAEADAASFLAAARNYVETGRSRSVRRGKDRSRGWEATARTLGLDYGGDAGAEPTLIEGGLAQRWRDRPVAEITGDDLHVLVQECAERGVPGRAPRVRGARSDSRGREMAGVLSAMFAHLLRRRWLRASPAVGLDKPPAAIPRDRALNADANVRRGDEVRWFWKAASQMPQPFEAALKLMLLLGQRREEISGMRQDELSDDLTWWSLPGERTKNGEPHKLPLPPLARELIAAVPAPALPECPFVFSTTGTTPVSGWSKCKKLLDEKMLAVAREEDPKATVEPWRLHDLRRTCATGMGEIGVEPHVVELVLNHISGTRAGVAGTYNRSEMPEAKRDALARWQAHVLALAADNVVPMRGRRRA